MAVLGKIRWMPPVGRTNGRRWGDPMAAIIGGSNVGRRGRRASVAIYDCQRALPRTAAAAVRRVCLELACCGLANSCWPRISSGPYFGDRCPDVWLTSVPLLERPPCKPSLRPTVLRSPSSTLATDLDDGGHFRGAIFEGSVFTGHSRSKLAPERSWPAAELAISAAARSWRIGRSFKEGGRQHPMIFSSCRLRFFACGEPGSVDENRAFAKSQSGDARASRAKPEWAGRARTGFSAVCARGSVGRSPEADTTTKSAGAAARSWCTWWSFFVGHSCRNGM